MHAPTNLNHLAYRFMADTKANIIGKAMPGIDVQVAAAYRTGGHAHDRIAITLQHRVRPRLAAYITRAVIAERSHIKFVSLALPRKELAACA